VLRYLAAALATIIAAAMFSATPAYAHFFGATKEVDGFQIVFQPYPQTPVIGTNSTLNFSVLKDGYNVYNIYSAVTMSSKKGGHVIFQDPYRFYEISDITIPYRFNQTGDYVLTVQTRIPGDPKYESQPLEASFDVSAFPPGIPLDELMLYYVTPATAAIAGIAIYMRSRGKL
jgi:hypothetical protein